MSEKPTAGQPSPSQDAVAVARPPELRFLLPEQPTKVKSVIGSAGIIYGAIALLVMAFASFVADPLSEAIKTHLPDEEITDIVFLNTPGPGGGGGGGGNRSPDPPKTTPKPAIKPMEATPVPVPVENPPPPPEPTPPAAQVEAVPIDAPVAVVAAAAPSLAPSSMGSGSGTGAGTGIGSGIGSGKGSGLGEGEGGGTGGGVYQVGSGVSPPVQLYAPKPQYTSEAMLRRIQGEVMLSCVVLKTGDMGKCNIVKSLDSNNFGLDDEALKAASRFKFKPGTRQGEPVAVQVNIILAFNMR